jgi:hypothetical protein
MLKYHNNRHLDGHLDSSHLEEGLDSSKTKTYLEFFSLMLQNVHGFGHQLDSKSGRMEL